MEAVETALEVHKVLNDNLEVVDDVESINNEGVEVQDSVEEMVKIDKASAAPDMATMTVLHRDGILSDASSRCPNLHGLYSLNVSTRLPCN